MSYLPLPNWKDSNVPIIVTSTLAIGIVARLAFQAGRKHDKIFLSPRDTVLPNLTEKEKNELPYPPDLLPGGRDVETPYGTTRVYEFGPEDGKRVLFVHGVSTPCISLGNIAVLLAEKGCRVMLFDLWGRGYSDSPADIDHDGRLYASQIMFAVTSSDLEWKSFSLIGYSMGGGVSADFASYFPKMIDSLILFAPAGLIRPEHLNSTSRIIYSSGIVPESVLLWLAKRRLQAGPIRSGKPVSKNKPNVEDAVNAEAKDTSSPSQNTALFKSHPHVNMFNSVQWQITNHPGFIPAFISSIRYAPLSEQQATWKRIGLFLSTQTASPKKRWQNNKVLVIAGSTDPVILPKELKEDIDSLVGEDFFQWEIVEGGHDFPSVKSFDTAKIIAEFWEL